MGLLLLFFPLFVFGDFPLITVNGMSGITQTKLITHLVTLAAFSLAVCAAAIGRLRQGRRPRVMWRRLRSADYWPEACLLIFLAGGVVSWLCSGYFGQLGPSRLVIEPLGINWRLDLIWFGAGRYDGLFFWFTYGLVVLLVSRYCRLRYWVVRAFAWVLLAMCTITAIELCGINILGLYPPALYAGTHANFVATIGNVDMMSGFLCLTLPLVGVGYVVFKTSRPAAVLFLASHTLAIYCLFAIDVESGLVGLAALVAIMTPMLLRNRRYACKLMDLGVSLLVGLAASLSVVHTYIKAEQRTQTTLHLPTVAVVCLAGAAILVLARLLLRRSDKARTIAWRWVRLAVVLLECAAVAGGFVFLRFVYTPAAKKGLAYDLYELVRGRLADSAGHNRGGIWKTALQMARSHWLIGTGTGTFAKTFKAFAPLVDYTEYAHKNLDFAHNEYIHILCTQGVVGLLSYLGFLGTAAWRALRQIRQNPRVLVPFACVLGYSVQLFFSFNVVIVAPVFFVLVGLLLAEARHALQPVTEWTDPPEPDEPAETEPDEPAAE